MLCSQLLKDGFIEASALQQLECFKSGVLFARTEGIIPAPEATHAIAQVIREAELAKLEGTAKTIVFNLCGHGFVDMQAYEDYFAGRLTDHYFTEKELRANLAEVEVLQPKVSG